MNPLFVRSLKQHVRARKILLSVDDKWQDSEFLLDIYCVIFFSNYFNGIQIKLEEELTHKRLFYRLQIHKKVNLNEASLNVYKGGRCLTWTQCLDPTA